MKPVTAKAGTRGRGQLHTDLIYDVGLHNGDDTAYYLALGYRVVAIEADPMLAATARLRFGAEISSGQLKILNVGIAREPGVRPFWICEGKSEWNSFDQGAASRGGRKSHAVEVNYTRFSSVLNEFGVPGYLKIDIEGADLDCIHDLDPADLPLYLSIELTDDRVFSILKDLGYRRFKIVVQNCHRSVIGEPRSVGGWLRHRLPLYLKTARHRLGLKVWTRTVPLVHRDRPQAGATWRFAYGSSGPFGEQTTGDWRTFDEITALWEQYRAGNTEYGAPSEMLWQDLHVGLG